MDNTAVKRSYFSFTYRPHVTLLEPPTFGGVDESSSDRPDSQTVAAVLSAPEVLLEGTDREDD